MTSFQSEFYEKGHAFLDQLLAEIRSSGIPLKDHWDIDHICYRAGSLDSYKRICAEISSFGALLSESDVNGRPIATYKLSEPLRLQDYFIDVVEVPAPKGSDGYEDGFEHVEIVVDVPFTELKTLFPSKVKSSLAAKALNAEFKVTLPNCNLKYHHLSLESLIRLENSPAYEALKTSKILESFTEFEPLVAGTFGLGVHTPESDLDILMTMKDQNKLQALLEKSFSGMKDYKLLTSKIDGEPTVICNFNFQEVSFEIFAQQTSSAQQQAYRHFQIEERLLKLGKVKLREKVHTLRHRGEKTEPAFASALNLAGDPYKALLSLHSQSNATLRNLLLESERKSD